MNVFPELVAGPRVDVEPGRWSIEVGLALRGEASCNVTERILRVPAGRDASARIVRAHELVHARVSPHVTHFVTALAEVTPRSLECAEEFRVNTLLRRVDFDTENLRDGSEQLAGERLATRRDWAETVYFLFAVVGTGGERAFFRGVRKIAPEWLAPLRALRKEVDATVRGLPTPLIAATEVVEGMPLGFREATLPVARLLTRAAGARPPEDAQALRGFRRSLVAGGRRPATGRFAPLVTGVSDSTIAKVTHRVARRRGPATQGTDLRYPARLLSDPHRRAFAARRPGRGGVILIDQSGSMALEAEALRTLLAKAPDSLVLGYSHRPGDQGSTPNAWVLARQGLVASPVPTGNVGNGVDGPALRWALSLRRGAEPLIWVTDGQITDANDHPDEDLARECARLVRRHRIQVVTDVTAVLPALRHGRVALPVSQLGRLGRALAAFA